MLTVFIPYPSNDLYHNTSIHLRSISVMTMMPYQRQHQPMGWRLSTKMAHPFLSEGMGMARKNRELLYFACSFFQRMTKGNDVIIKSEDRNEGYTWLRISSSSPAFRTGIGNGFTTVRVYLLTHGRRKSTIVELRFTIRMIGTVYLAFMLVCLVMDMDMGVCCSEIRDEGRMQRAMNDCNIRFLNHFVLSCFLC